MESYIANDEFHFDRRFLDRPAELPVISELQQLLGFWLRGVGVPQSSAAAVADRLPSYFVYALDEEWRKNTRSYKPLADASATPFAAATEREWSWASYAALLQRQVAESVFDEPFSLAQIFVPLNGYYFDKRTGDRSREEIAHLQERRRIVVNLQEELAAWAENHDTQDTLRVLSGGPGSGKSSFAKMLAAYLAAKNRRVLFIPLHLIDPAKDLVDEVGRYLKDQVIFNQNPLDPNSPELNLTIIFDGLDELASQGKAAAETARDFVREIEKTLDRRNHQTVKLRVLISGREVIVQQNESELRRNKQVLFLLPYFVSEDRKSFQDPGGLLQTDYRQQWWQKYGALTGRAYQGLPEPLAREDLDEITAQPLLNFLVALSFTREKIDFSKAVNLNLIYDDLVKAVYERGYEKRRPYSQIRQISLEDFSRVLEEIALAAWHGDGRTTTVREIQEHCTAAGLEKLLSVFREGAEAGITRLLAAFFFRQHGVRAGGDATFVFTHKSFGEFLTACRLIRGIRKLHNERRKREQNPDEGWSEKEALKLWAQLCGPTAVSQYLFTFLANETARIDTTEISQWQQTLTELFNYVLRHGTPMEQIIEVKTFAQAMFQARNAEEALLASLNACAQRTGKISEVKPPDSTAFGTWLKRIQGQRSGGQNVLAASCLSYLDLRESICHMADLHMADLSHSRLVGAGFVEAGLSRSNLRGAILQRAYMQGAKLYGANLQRADLKGANMERADLGKADLRGANLKGAHLEGADVSNTILDGVEPKAKRASQSK